MTIKTVVNVDKNKFSPKVLKDMAEHAQQLLQKNRFVGMLSVGDNMEKLHGISNIDYSKISHKITKFEYNEDMNNLVAEFEFLDTPSGKIAQQLYPLGLIDLSARIVCLKSDNIDAAMIVSCDFIQLDEEYQKRKKREIRLIQMGK